MKLTRKEKALNREIWNAYAFLQKQAALGASQETPPSQPSSKSSIELNSPQIKQKSKATKSTSLSSAPAIPTPKLLPNNKLPSSQSSSAMTYEKRLTTYTNWPHNKLSAAEMAAAGWRFEADPVLLDHVRCPSCYAVKWDWSESEDPLQKHLELQCKACPVAQALARAATKVLAKSASSAVSTLPIAPEPSKLSKVKSPKFEVSTISSGSCSPTNTSQSEALVAADSELQSKPIWFKTERFTSTSSCSASMKPCPEPDTQSAVILAANFSAMAPPIMTYEARLATFKKWPHTSPTPEALATAGFSYELGTADLTTCSECGLALANCSYTAVAKLPASSSAEQETNIS